MPFLTNEHLTRKVHISLTAIYHLAVHNYFPFFICFSRGDCVKLVYGIVLCLCNSELECCSYIRLYQLLFTSFDPLLYLA